MASFRFFLTTESSPLGIREWGAAVPTQNRFSKPSWCAFSSGGRGWVCTTVELHSPSLEDGGQNCCFFGGETVSFDHEFPEHFSVDGSRGQEFSVCATVSLDTGSAHRLFQKKGVVPPPPPKFC
ncbi:hypothetical protein TGVAND_207065 [Toxoplasma gondii VAND]|uniref:Uncharacterized protein n=1 Tax=Toxoplasma gondii VAND TaxID=933077 RepID=A0A086PGB1_TOXGO|nr:hypothetical protein TGVAND_207065 [Toxoplasma gondii VAND]